MRIQRESFQPAVAVPVRNEARRLPRLIQALGQQSWHGPGRRLTLVLVLNNCTDASRDVAREAVRGFPQIALDLVEVDFPEAQSHVGSARRLAMERALAGCPDPATAAILTTDADSVPAPDWIEANLAALSAGADLVGGHISGDREEEARLGPGFARRAATVIAYGRLCDRLASLIDPLPHDPWPRHGDHTGASLAVRGDIYEAVGGLPALPFREDLGFVSRVRAAGGRLVHPLGVKVEVSARLVGRAPGGMADCLKDWLRAEAEGSPILVEDPGSVAARLLRRRAVRDLGAAPAALRGPQACALGLDPAALVDPSGRLPSGAALVEAFAPDLPDAPATVPVALATAEVTAMIAAHEGATRAA